MYTSFYNLKERPFSLSTSPGFLYLGKAHKEALSLLTYGIIEKKGFVLLTGEAGTGKTTIVRSLLKKLDPTVKCAFISNPILSPEDFLAYTAYKLGLKRQSKSKGFLLIQIEALLKIFLGRQQNAFLIIDEAQDLSFRLLEEIRLLSNMEINGKRLIHIFLIGQPILNNKLNNNRCRSLLQRINMKYHINPLNLSETEEYIKGRLQAVGSKSGKLFSKDAISLIHQYSSGIPRNINSLCDNALLLGYSKTKKNISANMIQECYNDMHPAETFFIEETTEKPSEGLKQIKPRRLALKAAILILILAILLIAGSYTSIGKRQIATLRDFYGAHFSKDSNLSKDVSSTSPQISPGKLTGGNRALQKSNKVKVKINQE
ncbi:MAG: AAA family ATPase [Thermodesulfobacteriota bacterium]|nr:AAA family ATPase [Thermodesulfobacteriota bacterium]